MRVKEEIPLTVIDPKLEKKRARTPPGMAFWAGTGPEGTTCRECLNYGHEGYYSANSKNGSTLRPGPCAKFQSMMGKRGPSLPYKTPSCKYFAINNDPHPVQQPQRN